MTTPASGRGPAPASVNLRGAVDLSSLKRPQAPAAAPGQGGPGQPEGSAQGRPAFIVDVDQESFSALVQLSAQVPVVVELTAPWSDQAQQLSAVTEKVATEYAGRFVLGRVDVDANPQIGQAFQLQSVPAAVALLKGQPIPLFQGAASEEELRSFVAELLKVAEANGVTGTAPSAAGEPQEEPPLPPLHQEAFDAIEAGDYAAAAAAYRKALAEAPADNDARSGLAQVELMQRLEGADANAIREAAASAPDDVAAQLAVADLDISGGHVEDAFSRLVKFVGLHSGEDREAARARLVELFEVIGTADPRVSKARQALARALF